MLSNRLRAIYSLLNIDDNIADIGCDHGYLLIEIRKNTQKNVLLGVDNKKGPFDSFTKNLKLNNMEQSIETSLSNGLEAVDNRFNCIVLAGIGTDNIINIINKSKEKLEYISSFVIDSHTDTSRLRDFMVKNGYLIEKEKILVEDNIKYEVIRFIKGKANYSKLELKYGPILLKEKNKDFIEIYKKRLNDLEKLVKTINNKDYNDKIVTEINEIKEIIK